MSSVPISFRIAPEKKLALEAAAKALDRTPAYLVSKAVDAYLEAREEKRRALEAAVARADEGTHFISSEAIHAWMKAKANGENPPLPEPDIPTK